MYTLLVTFICTFSRLIQWKRGGIFSRCFTVVFSVPRYIELVRRLQTVYRMEPAGSQGVWALDDHQFLPFIWGSSQLIGTINIEKNREKTSK